MGLRYVKISPRTHDHPINKHFNIDFAVFRENGGAAGGSPATGIRQNGIARGIVRAELTARAGVLLVYAVCDVCAVVK